MRGAIAEGTRTVNSAMRHLFTAAIPADLQNDLDREKLSEMKL